MPGNGGTSYDVRDVIVVKVTEKQTEDHKVLV